MSKIRVRHVTCKAGVYYFEATPPMRAAGISSARLGRDMTLAIERAHALNAEWDRARRGETVKLVERNTIRWLIVQYQRDESYQTLTPKTRKSVDFYMAIIEGKLGDLPAAAFTPEHIRKFRKAQASAVSDDHAWRLVKELRKLFALARSKGIRADNPAAGLRLPGQLSRDQIWHPLDLSIFVATADALGRPSIGTAALLMYELAQSPIDARVMTWAALRAGVFRFRRSKTSKLAERKGKRSVLIEIPATQRLLARLAPLNGESVQVVISEETGRPYREFDFSHWCRRVRWAADLPDGLQMLDLRRSRAVHLAEAGATAVEIAAITGHSIHTTERILETYIPRTGKMAAAAIEKGERGTKVGKAAILEVGKTSDESI
jgi:hypothetical protein